jgi:hypothetical protein
MAESKKGILRRLRELFTAAPESSPQKREPAKPWFPEPPEEPTPGERVSHEGRMREIYTRVNNGKLTEYLDWRELFMQHEVVFAEPMTGTETPSPAVIQRQVEEGFNLFLRAFKLSTHQRGHVKRETFFSRTGIPRSEIDWALWRDIMGYSGKK